MQINGRILIFWDDFRIKLDQRTNFSFGRGFRKRKGTLPSTCFHFSNRTLRDLDARFLGAPAGPDPGPLVTRFRALGGLEEGKLVAEPWGRQACSPLIQLFFGFASE